MVFDVVSVQCAAKCMQVSWTSAAVMMLSDAGLQTQLNRLGYNDNYNIVEYN